MSNAKPMTTERRGVHLPADPAMATPRQWRQFARMDLRNVLRAEGTLRHGASGERVRKPILRTAQPPSQGSIATHVMVPPPGLPVRARFWDRKPR